MELLETLRKRRSIRKYTGESIRSEHLKQILKAGLLSASSRNIRPWELIVVQDKETLKYLSKCRVGAAKMLENADCAVIVVADAGASDVWVEDCSIVMSNMHLMAASLGVGSCWVQGRKRQAEDKTTEEYIRERLGFPKSHQLEAILSLGMPAEQPEAYQLDEVKKEKIHWEKY